MKKNQDFWTKLKIKKKTIIALAPMAGFTDSAFRQICKKFGADVVYSEMASATALVYNPKKTLELISVDKKEFPYIVQLFGSNPEHFKKAIELITDKKAVAKLGIKKYLVPSGIDINFGCPVPKVAKQKAGAELFKDLNLSREIIKVCLEASSIPVSIKTRTQAGQVDLISFLKNISDLNVSAIMIHGRTLKQGFSGEIDYEIIKNTRKYFKGIILANGGIVDVKSAKKTLELTGADGLGIGRGALGKPWIFEEIKKEKFKIKNRAELFKIILKHAKLVDKLKGERGMVEMRAHFCHYVQGMAGARELRQELVKVENFKDLEKILKKRD